MKTIFSLLSLVLVKFHYRPIRTVITILFSSVLFSVLVALAVTLSGFNHSIDTYKDNGLNGRFIVTARPNSNQTSKLTVDNNITETAKKLQGEEQAEKTAYAKQIGVEYNPNSEQPAVVQNSNPNGPEDRLNLRSPISVKALDMYYANHPIPGQTDLQDIAKPYHPIDLFSQYTIHPSHQAGLTLLPDPSRDKAADDILGGYFISIPLMSDQLVKPFIYDDMKWQPSDGTIPVVVSFKIAAVALGIDDYQNAKSPKDQLKILSDISTKAKGKIFTACYRNSVAADNGVDENCHTKDDKPIQSVDISEGQKKFNQKYGIEYEPLYKNLKFEIVGVSPDMTDSTQDIKDVKSVVQMIIKSAAIYPFTVPASMYSQLKDSGLTQYFEPYVKPFHFEGSKPDEGLFVEFANRTDLNNFIADKSCHSSASGLCLPETNVFELSAFDSTTEAFDDLRAEVASLSEYIALAISALAIVMLAILISYISTSSRRESAVYRALGFRRGQLAAIFIFYSLVIALFVLVLSFIIGWVFALLLDTNLSPMLDVQAQLAFGISSSGSHFSLIGSNPTSLLQIAALIIVSGLIASIFPILLSLRRSPAKDLRSE